MNRTNSVEPVFSQPLQVTYHQLLQNKSKIEDELYQTQRQLRRKEGEYQKKIAVYEQKIDQLQEQIEDFREREDNMKSMYEKILNALNSQSDKQMFPNIDLERVQEMLLQIQKSHQNSPTHSEKSMNSSFRRGGGGRNGRQEQEFQKEKDKLQEQIHNLEISVMQLTEFNNKSKADLSQKEKDNQQLQTQIESLKRSLDISQKDVDLAKQSNQDDIDQIRREAESKIKNELCQQIDSYQQQFMIERDRLVSQIENLEGQLQKSQTSYQQKAFQQERSFIKELSEVKQANEKYRNDLDSLIKEKETLVKEKDLLFQQVKEQNQSLTKLMNQKSVQTSLNQNDFNKQLQAKVTSLENDLVATQEKNRKLNSDIECMQKQYKQQSNQPILKEKSHSGGASVSQSLSNFSQVKNVNVGSKDQQVLVDIQTSQGKRKMMNTGGSKTNRISNSKNQSQVQNTKMFPQQVTINIDNNQAMPTILESTKAQKKNPNPKTSRNSNGITHSSLANPQTFMPKQEQDKIRTHTPLQERHLVELDEIHSQNTSQILSSNHKKNMLDSSINSGAKSNQNLQRYINTNEVRHFENMLSRSNSQSCYPEQTKRFHNFQQRSPQDNSKQVTKRQGTEFQNDVEKTILSSMEIEQVVRKMLEQVNYEKQNQYYGEISAQGILKPSQFHNMQTPSQNVSFTLKKNLEQSQFNNSKYSSQNSKGQLTVDREFLIQLENSLKKLAKSNEKIKQIMKEKETYEQLYLKLKQKIKILKDEKANWLQERENLIQSNHKMECKLKQAQVILNLESEMQNQPSYLQNNNTNNNNTAIYDMSHNSSQKTLIRHFGQRDISPGAQSNLTLNIIQDAVGNNERYKNPPMSCRVNDSYDVSLRMNPDNSYGALTRKPMFHNTLDRSLLDQSLITIKRDLMNQNYQNNSNLLISQISNNNAQIQNQSYQSKFLPNSSNIQLFPIQPSLVNQNSSSSTYRGKAPTLQINLSQNPNNNEMYTIGISTQNNQDSQVALQERHAIASSQERDDQSSVMTSMNLSKSTSNLGNRKATYQKQQQPPRQLFKYQSNRSPQNRAFQNYQNTQIVSGQNTIQKPHDMNLSNIAIAQNDQSQLSQFMQNKVHQNQLNISSNTSISNVNKQAINKSQNIINNQTQSNSFIMNQQSQNVSSVNQQSQGLRRLNSNKAKDRYYSNKRGSQQVQSIGRNVCDKQQYKYVTHQTEISAVYPKHNNQMLTFEDEEDYLIEEQHTLEDDQQDAVALSMTMGGRKNLLNQRAQQQQRQMENNMCTTVDSNRQNNTHMGQNNEFMSCTGRSNTQGNGHQMNHFYQQNQQFDGMFSDNQVNIRQDDEEDANMVDTDENESVNCFGGTIRTEQSGPTTTTQDLRGIKRPPVNRLSTCSLDNRQIRTNYNIEKINTNTHQQHQQQQDMAVIPTDERSSDEESVQYKMLNNSNFVPFMHSRYVNDDIQ